MISKIRTKLGDLIFKIDGGKRVLNKENSIAIGTSSVVIAILSQLLPPLFKSDIPKGTITKSDRLLLKEKVEVGSQHSAMANKQQNIGGVTDLIPRQKQVVAVHHYRPIIYKGKQVIGPDASSQKIPTGSNFIGKLLNSIDTRSSQRVHVILPYGGSHKSGGGSLPPDTILMGQFNYSGVGDRIFILFTRAIFPDGQEIALQAQALSSKDYRAGVIGEYHGNKGGQMASVLGLSMVNGISEVMVEKVGLGQSFNVTPKATIKNGIYNGVAKVTEMEANDQASQLAQSPKYVTLDSGTDLIISIGESFGTNERQE